VTAEGYGYDEELEEIKRRKLLEYQRRLAEAARAEEERRLEEARRQEVLRRILTPKARERLANLKMVRPQLVEALEAQLIQLAYSGRIATPITDEELKSILRRLMSTQKEIRLRFMRSSLG